MWIWKKKSNNYPKFYQIYLEKIRDEGFSKNIVCFDLETTDLNYKTADVLSFGGIIIRDLKISPTDSLHYFFQSDASINQSTVIHEIIPEKNSKTIANHLPEIISFISNNRILGHFVEFDLNILNRELKKIDLPKLKNPTLDTLKIALKHDGVTNLQYAEKDKYTLFNLARRFQLDIQHTHNALEDAYITSLLYLHLQH